MKNKNVYMPRVAAAKYIKNYVIRVEFTNGVRKEIDFKKYLGTGIFEKLNNIKNFKKFFVDGWTVAWENGADVTPETLYEEEQEVVGKKEKIKNIKKKVIKK
ncbi:MAG: DUF2442 domain-containing protein [Oligoflexia bacterium]|nr:DUF2442 domain-containing protein [Oligoflexia bacterium]